MSSLAKESKLLAKHSLIYGLGTLLNRIASFLLLPVYTRFLSVHDYGIKELVGLSTDVIGILLATAISSSIYRFYFEYQDTTDRNEVISSAVITIAVIGLVALSILSCATKAMAKYILDSSDLYYFFLISLCSMWFQALNNIGYLYLRANQQSLKFITLSFGKLMLTIGLNVYFLCFLKTGVVGVLISTLITSILMSIVLILPLLYRVGVKFSHRKIKEIVKYGMPLIPAQLAGFVVNLSGRFFIKGYCSIAEAGLYSLGARFGSLPGDFISGPFNQTWQPRRFELCKETNSEKIFGKIFTYFLVVMTLAGLGVSILTRDVLMIMAGEEFWSAYKVVPILVLASIVLSFQYHFDMGLLIKKKTKYLAYINMSNALVVLVLNFFLIQLYGVYGAAYVILIGFVYRVSMTYYFSSKYYRIHFEFVRIAKILFAAALIYVATLPIHIDSLYMSLTVKTGIILLYPVFLLCFNFYSENEKKKIARFIKLRLLAVKGMFVS